MLELLLLLPFIMLSILSMTFDIYVDELYHVNGGARSGKRNTQKLIFLNLIFREDKVTTHGENQPRGFSVTGQLDNIIDLLESKEKQTDYVKAGRLRDEKDRNYPNVKVGFVGEIFYYPIHYDLPTERTQNRNWKPPV